jgi:protein-S-isoprenylcysteine O-methyltransferase Ste14
MADERGSWIDKVDTLIWVAGALLVLAAVLDGTAPGRTLISMLRGSWVFSSLLCVGAAIVLIAIVSRWRASREEADLRRKYPPRDS